jgi:exosortase H (IPTLxxWG-CTERM-specific)
MLRFLITFLLILGILFGAQLTPWGQEYFVIPWTNELATICQTLVSAFDKNVEATGKILRSTTTGVEATIVLLAAILSFPSTVKHKLLGFLAGIVAVQGLNIVRVISLFYIGQWSMHLFELMHLYVWQALIMLDVLIVWLVWIRTLPGPKDSPPTPPSTPATLAAA